MKNPWLVAITGLAILALFLPVFIHVFYFQRTGSIPDFAHTVASVGYYSRPATLLMFVVYILRFSVNYSLLQGVFLTLATLLVLAKQLFSMLLWPGAGVISILMIFPIIAGIYGLLHLTKF